MPDALATSLIEGTFRFLERLVWPLFLVYVVNRPVVQGWITVLVERIAEAIELRIGGATLKFPPASVALLGRPARETISDKPPIPFSRRPPQKPPAE